MERQKWETNSLPATQTWDRLSCCIMFQGFQTKHWWEWASLAGALAAWQYVSRSQWVCVCLRMTESEWRTGKRGAGRWALVCWVKVRVTFVCPADVGLRKCVVMQRPSQVLMYFHVHDYVCTCATKWKQTIGSASQFSFSLVCERSL